jgi:hypothetical protein
VKGYQRRQALIALLLDEANGPDIPGPDLFSDYMIVRTCDDGPRCNEIDHLRIVPVPSREER